MAISCQPEELVQTSLVVSGSAELLANAGGGDSVSTV